MIDDRLFFIVVLVVLLSLLLTTAFVILLVVMYLCCSRLMRQRSTARIGTAAGTRCEEIRTTPAALHPNQAEINSCNHQVTSSHNTSARYFDQPDPLNQSCQQPFDYNRLTPDNFQEVYGKLYDAKHKWYNIGIQLGMTDDLNAIKQDNRNESDPCLRELLMMWLRQGKATWTALIHALNSRSVLYPNIATSLLPITEVTSNGQMHEASTVAVVPNKEGFKCPLCGGCLLQEYLDGKCPKNHLSDSSFRCLDIDQLTEDDQAILYMKLKDETDDIKKYFAEVINSLRQALKRLQNVESNDIACYIFDIAQSDSLTNPLRSSESHYFAECNTIDKIINYLQQNNYVSFINFSILEDLIFKYGIEDKTVKDLLASYQKKFMKFCERSIFEVPQSAYGDAPADGEKLKFKVTDDFVASLPHMQRDDDFWQRTEKKLCKKSSETLKMSVDDTLAVQKRVAHALELKNIGCLVFLGAQKGCVELIFSAPRGVMDSLKPELKTINVSAPTKSAVSSRFANLEAMGIHIICGPPSKPKAVKHQVTYNSITLKWKKPEYNGFYPVQMYYIHYRSYKDQVGIWRTIRTENLNTNFEIKKLPPNRTPFVFKLQAVNEIGAGIESKVSDQIHLRKLSSTDTNRFMNRAFPSKPGKPQATNITHDAIKLEWTKPKMGAENVTSYTILYRCIHDPHEHWREQKAITTDRRAVVSHLLERTKYMFKVQPECEAGVELESSTSDYIRTEVKISNKPGRPTALKVTHDSILLRWTKPELEAHNITSYTVFYKSSNNLPEDWTKHQVVTTEEALVTQLSECSIYYFKIRSDTRDKAIESNISRPIMTKMVIPSKPGKPRALEITHDSIELEWTKPECGDHHVTSYTVLYRAVTDPPDKWLESRNVSNKNPRVVISHLSESTVYYFKVRPECAIESASQSDASEPVETKMLLPGKPGKPRALSIAHDHIVLRWTKPDKGAHNIISNTVFFRAAGDPIDQFKSQTVGADHTNHIIVTQLRENTAYYFRVCSECRNGFWVMSHTSEPIITKMILPGKPGKPRALEIKENNVLLVWRKPVYGAHNITSYTVFYHSEACPHEWKKQKAFATNESVLVSKLSENTVYHFKVRPECEANNLMSGICSDISDPIQTSMVIPSVPRYLKASNVTHDSVQLDWTQPEKGAHNVTSYTIRYHSDAERSWVVKETNSTEQTAFIPGLSAETTYLFRIRAECQSGLRPMESNILLIRTKTIPVGHINLKY